MTRSRIVEVDMPVFDKVTSRVEVLFDGAVPLLGATPYVDDREADAYRIVPDLDMD